jgi:hypothetical protein
MTVTMNLMHVLVTIVVVFALGILCFLSTLSVIGVDVVNQSLCSVVVIASHDQ